MAETVLEAASGLAVFGLTYVGVTAAVSYLVQNEPYEANFVLKGLAHILPVKPSRIFAAPGPFIYSREYIACQGHNMTKCMAKFEPVMELSVSTNETVTIDNNTTVSLAAFWSTRKLEDTISYLLPEGSSVHTYTLLRYIFALVQDGSRFLSRKAPEFGIHNFEDLCFVVIYCLLVPLAVVVFRAEVWRFMKALSADVDAFCHKHFEDPAVDETTRKEAQHTERIASENDWLIERVAYLEVTQTPATSQAHDVSAQGMDSPTMWTDTFVDFVRANLATISAMLDTIEQKFCLEAEERVSKTVKDLQEELEASKNLNAEANKKAEKAATSLKRTATGQQQEANKHSDAVKEHAKTQIRRNKELSSTRDELERVKLAKTEALKTANDTSKIDIARLDRAIMALEEQVDAQSSEKKKLQKARDDALDTCEELQGDYENLEYHLEEVQATADEASAKVVDLEGECQNGLFPAHLGSEFSKS